MNVLQSFLSSFRLLSRFPCCCLPHSHLLQFHLLTLNSFGLSGTKTKMYFCHLVICRVSAFNVPRISLKINFVGFFVAIFALEFHLFQHRVRFSHHSRAAQQYLHYHREYFRWFNLSLWETWWVGEAGEVCGRAQTETLIKNSCWECDNNKNCFR